MASFYPTTNDCQVVKVTSWTGSGTSKRVSAYDVISGLNAQKYYFPIINEEDITPVFGAWNATYAQYADSVVVAKTAKDSATQKYYIYDTEAYPGKLDSVKNIFGSSSLYHAILMGNGSSAGEAASVMELIQQFLFTNFGCPIESSYTTLDAGTSRYFMDVTTHIGYETGGNLKTSGSGHWYQWNLPIAVISGSTTRICNLRMNGSPDTNNLVYFTIRRENSWDAYPAITYDPYTPPSSGNPYPNIPDSAPGGGNGPGIGGSDSNPVPPLPSISAVGTGMCRLYNPTVSQLIDLGAWLWGSGLDLTQLKKIFQDPMDIILGCSIFPVAMPGNTTEHIMFGNLDSEVSAKVVSSQYTTRDLGTIQIPETYNSYLDYSPYTKIQLYLPYIGMKQLNTDEVMGKTLGVVYSIDLLSGACVAHVYVESQLMYEFGGTCNTQIPLTARDYTATVQSLVGIVAGAAVAGFAVATLPESVPLAAGATGAVGAFIGNSVKNTVSAKPTVEHASAIGGSTGIMASQHAYVIMEVPNLCHPPNQEHFTGYPGFIYGKVSDFQGYTKFINFEFINIHATEPELQELQDWFMNKGVRI